MTRFPPLVSRLIPSLGRDNDNEVAITARAIGSALRTAGLDWHDLARTCSTAASCASGTAPTGARRHAPAFGDMARTCRDLDRGRLTAHERAFVADMVRRGFSFGPSQRQEQWLAAIFDRLTAGRAAA